MQIVGIDCAAQPKNVGYAYYDGDAVMAVGVGSPDPAAEIDALVDWAFPVLLAMDAPLGWPKPMADTLGVHRPGEVIQTAPNEFFRRRTDCVVHAALRKPPLDIGADRIARAAHGALSLLARLRERSGLALPVLVQPWEAVTAGVIEVYPAGTLKAWGHPFKGYKGREPRHRSTRAEIARRLGNELVVPTSELLKDSDDALDAVVCVLAAIDYMDGACIEPGPDDEARRSEGWIWVRNPVHTG